MGEESMVSNNYQTIHNIVYSQNILLPGFSWKQIQKWYAKKRLCTKSN